MNTTTPGPDPLVDAPAGTGAASGARPLDVDASRPRRARVLSHLVVLLAGLGVTIWGAVRLTHRTIKCHGVVMHPGDSCRTSSFSQLNGDKLMSYELLHRQAEISQPFVIGAGVLLAAFGALLLWQELRRAR